MSKTRFTGPVESKNGFKLVSSSYGDRGMTIVATSIIRTKAASAASTLTQLCGLTRCIAAWGNVRQPSIFGTQLLVSAIPYGWGSTVTVQLLANMGTGQRIPVMAGNATVTCFMLGY